MKTTHAIYMFAAMAVSFSVSAETVPRDFDFLQMKRGGQLFQQYCASCHGKQGQGAANWRQRDAAGKSPAPPLNGTGHAWHHPTKVLVDVIKNGTQRIGGNMPAWKDKLTDAQILDIIAWFQTKWSDEIYTAWSQNNKRAKK